MRRARRIRLALIFRDCGHGIFGWLFAKGH
jgi:hypothetical protein